MDITALSITWISNREFAHDHVLHVSIFLETGIHKEGIKYAPSEEQHRRESGEETRQEQAEKGLDDAAEENPSRNGKVLTKKLVWVNGQLLCCEHNERLLKEEEEMVEHTAISSPFKGPNPVLRGPIFAAGAYWDSGFTDEGGNIALTPMVAVLVWFKRRSIHRV